MDPHVGGIKGDVLAPYWWEVPTLLKGIKKHPRRFIGGGVYIEGETIIMIQFSAGYCFSKAFAYFY